MRVFHRSGLSAARMPSGRLSLSPPRLALACALRFWRLARNCSASRAARSALAFEPVLSSLIVPLPCRLIGIGGFGAVTVPCPRLLGFGDKRRTLWPANGRDSTHIRNLHCR